MKANYSVMTEKSIVSVSTAVKNASEKLAEVSTYMGSLEGACDVIRKYWDKNKATKVSFHEVIDALGLPYSKPSDLRKAIIGMASEKHIGVHAGMVCCVEKKNSIEMKLGVWGSKSLLNDRVAPVIDARGNETYPFVKCDEKIVKVDSIKPISKWTPELVCKVLIQNEALNTGKLTPFTAEMFWEGVDMGSIDMNSVDAEKAPIAAPLAAPLASAKAC